MTSLETYSQNSASIRGPKPAPKLLIAKLAGLLASTRGVNTQGDEYEAKMATFLAVLMDLPWEAVRLGILDWAKTEQWQPTPADLRKRALQFVERDDRTVVHEERPFGHKPVLSQERRAEIAREAGMGHWFQGWSSGNDEKDSQAGDRGGR